MTNHIEQMMKVAGVKPRFYMEVNVGDLDCNFQEVSEKTVKKLWENWVFLFPKIRFFKIFKIFRDTFRLFILQAARAD